METCLLSQLLFQYLSRIFGSEKAVRVRRLYYGVEDFCHNVSPFRRVNSGSKAEGLDFPGSDLDIMYIYLKKVVHPDITSCSQDDFPSLYISTDDAAPGFAHINVKTNTYGGSYSRIPTITIGGKKICVFYTENGIILQNSELKFFSIFLNLPRNDILYTIFNLSLKIHGPCLSIFNDSLDQMFAFKLHSWPNVAFGWIFRSRLSDWPSTRIISNIVQESVLLVPIGSKLRSCEDNPNEWRISFSLAEKWLVLSFNHTQLMCYVLLKLLLKEILNKNVITKNVLCSYFMKTILFWTIEETGCSVWIPNNLVKCFRACILKLSYLLKLKHLPNYFIPENNMIEGKLTEYSLSNLCSLLIQVSNEGVGFTSRTDTLKDFLTTIQRQLTIKYQADEIYVLRSLLEYHMLSKYFKRPGNFFFALNTFKNKLIRNLFFFCFLRYMSWFPFQEKYDINRRNKSLYCNYKSSIGYTVIGTKLYLTSWLLVAIIFYSHKNYNNTLKITDFIQSENLLMRIFAFDYENTMKGRFSVRQKIKLECCKSLVDTLGVYSVESIIAKTGILFASPVSTVAPFLLSQSLVTYLRFLCFHHFKNVSEKTDALFELREMAEEITNIDFCYRGIADCRYLKLYQWWSFVQKAFHMSHMRIPGNLVIKVKRIMATYLRSFGFNQWYSYIMSYKPFLKQHFNAKYHWLRQQQ